MHIITSINETTIEWYTLIWFSWAIAIGASVMCCHIMHTQTHCSTLSLVHMNRSWYGCQVQPRKMHFNAMRPTFTRRHFIASSIWSNSEKSNLTKLFLYRIRCFNHFCLNVESIIRWRAATKCIPMSFCHLSFQLQCTCSVGSSHFSLRWSSLWLSSYLVALYLVGLVGMRAIIIRRSFTMEMPYGKYFCHFK